MRSLQLIKTLFRTPFKTFLTFLLLFAVTFVLLSRVGEYSITRKEVISSAKEYRGVGSAEVAPAPETYPDLPYTINEDVSKEGDSSDCLYQPLSQIQISSLLELPYISSFSTRYMTAGVSDKYYRMVEGSNYYNYTERFIIEGTLSDIVYGANDNNASYNDLVLEGCSLLAGKPPWSIEDTKVVVHAYASKVEQGYLSSVGSSSGIVEVFTDSYKYYTKNIKNLTLGDRYVFIGRYDVLSDTMQFYLSDMVTDQWCPAIQSIEGQPKNYLATEKFKSLKELVELTNSDLHTFDIVYADDMSSIMRFAQGNMTITDGRELTKEDSDKRANVCVVSNDLASKNKLGVGDKISLTLGTKLFEQNKGIGAVAATRKRYLRPEKKVELEIVGIYIDTDSEKLQSKKPFWSYSINTIFVPTSLLPLDESKLDNHMFSPSEFSFTVDNAWDIGSFMESVRNATPQLDKMGLKIIFDDGGWTDIVDKYKLTIKLSMIAIIALSVAVVASIGFIIYLFIGRKKKEYAILRALGTTRKASVKTLLLPLMVLAVSAVLTGSLAAWIYTTNTISKSSTISKMTKHSINTSIPITVTVSCILGEILLVLVFAMYRIWRISAIPPLILLQDNQVKQFRGKKPEQVEEVIQVSREGSAVQTPISNVLDRPILNTAIRKELSVSLNIRYKRHIESVLRYVVKHMRRSIEKSILAVLLSALLFGAVGQFEVMRQSYIDLCNSSEVKAKFMDGLSLSSLDQVLKTGYVINPYYEYSQYVDFNNSGVDWVVTNDIAGYTEEETNITYAPGYDESCIKKFGNVCIIGDQLLKGYGLKLGDNVLITQANTLKDLQSVYIGVYKKAHPDNVLQDDKILELINDEIQKDILSRGSYYTIVGTVSTKSGNYGDKAFSPGTLNTTPILGHEISLDLAEFTLADNLQASAFRSYVKKTQGVSTDKYSSNGFKFVMDTSKIDNLLKTLSLLKVLFPVIIIIAGLIEGFVCGLIILHSSKEVAILRVLGTSRRRTSAIFILEQICYCMVGLILGALGLLLFNHISVINRILVELYSIAAKFFAGCVIGSFICGAITTNKKVLNLLQVKE